MKIKKAQPAGWKKTIADQMALKEDTVRKVMSGQRNNPQVVALAVDMAILPEDDKLKISNRLKAVKE